MLQALGLFLILGTYRRLQQTPVNRFDSLPRVRAHETGDVAFTLKMHSIDRPEDAIRKTLFFRKLSVPLVVICSLVFFMAFAKFPAWLTGGAPWALLLFTLVISIPSFFMSKSEIAKWQWLEASTPLLENRHIIIKPDAIHISYLFVPSEMPREAPAMGGAPYLVIPWTRIEKVTLTDISGTSSRLNVDPYRWQFFLKDRSLPVSLRHSRLIGQEKAFADALASMYQGKILLGIELERQARIWRDT